MSEMENIPQIKPDISDSFLDSESRIEESEVGSVSASGEGNDNKRRGNAAKAGKNAQKAKISGGSRKILLGVGIFLVSLLVLLGVLGFNLYLKGNKFYLQAKELAEAGRAQDLPKVKTQLTKSKSSLKEFQGAYKLISWTKYLPLVGFYVRDGEHFLRSAELGLESAEILTEAVEPYSDIIGLKNGSDAESGTETAQDRIDFVVKSLPELAPRVDELVIKVEEIREELKTVDPDRYPRQIAGRNIREPMTEGFELFDQLSNFVIGSKPVLENSDYFLGVDQPRTYLVLFQNDKELRPTGGFITAYSMAKVDNGKFEPILSADIYDLDNNYTPTVPASEPVIKYLKGPYLLDKNYRLRDMNWSPDFEKSMDLFSEESRKAGIEGVDGIIAVDTELLVNLLNVIGPVGVSGFGNYSTEIVPECNCPQVIYELESFADVEGPIVWSENEPGKIVFAPENYDDRKGIIGPLMNSILANTLGQPKEKLPALFNAGLKSLTEKHILLYMLDEKYQDAVTEFGIAGKIRDYDGDYLHVNDANLGGRKSNLYVQQEVVQQIEILEGGTIEKTLTLTYKNPEKYDGWLNSVLPNWVRVYVPKGSELISFEGLEEKKDPYEDLGKTVFAGFFQLRPQGVIKLTLKYTLPYKKQGDEYRMLIQKQPGTNKPLYIINMGDNQEEFFLKTDREIVERL